MTKRTLIAAADHQQQSGTRLPPQSLDAEKSLLGSIMLEPSVLDEVSQIIEPGDFYLDAHRLIYTAAELMHRKGTKIDAVTVGESLQASGKLAEIGPDLIEEIIIAVPHSAHAAYYADIVKKKSIRRRLICAGQDAIREAFDESTEIESVIATAESALHCLLERQAVRDEVTIGDLLYESISQITTGKRFGISSGFHELDKLLQGFQPGNLIVLAARPSYGKTALAVKFLYEAASAGVHVTMISLEQERVEIAERLLAIHSKIGVAEMRNAKGDESLCGQLLDAANQLNALPLLIDDRVDRTVSQIAAIIRLQQRKHGTKLAVVDYIQLITPSDRRAPREQQVAEMSRGLKLAAKSLGIPIMVLAQLNRQVESRNDKRPKLSDLRESGAIEQDADVVMFLHRPDMTEAQASGEQKPAKDGGFVSGPQPSLIIEKHRNGRRGEIPLFFRGELMDFSSATNPQRTYLEQYEFDQQEKPDQHWER